MEMRTLCIAPDLVPAPVVVQFRVCGDPAGDVVLVQVLVDAELYAESDAEQQAGQHQRQTGFYVVEFCLHCQIRRGGGKAQL